MTRENKVNSEPDLFKFVQVGFQVGLEFDKIVKFFSKCFKGVTEVSRGCLKDFQNMSQGCLKGVSSVFQVYLNGDLGFQGTVSRVSEKCPRCLSSVSS